MKREDALKKTLITLIADAETEGDWSFINKTTHDYEQMGYKFNMYDLVQESIKIKKRREY